MYQRLVLFDIDGTLLTANGHSVKALMAAFERVYGVSPQQDGYLMDGKTELRIVMELLAGQGVGPEEAKPLLPRFWQTYFDQLERTLTPDKVTVYPGVEPLLRQLAARRNVTLALLTGNCEESARLKLRAAKLDKLFAFGVYGQYEQERVKLPPLALGMARYESGFRVLAAHSVVIGDTPADIQCARPHGFKTLAVATGFYSTGDLSACQPDYVFADLADTQAVVKAVMAH